MRWGSWVRGAIAMAVAISSMLMLSPTASATPDEPDSATTTSGVPTTTIEDPFGLPIEQDGLEIGSRPGTTFRTQPFPPPPTTTTTTTLPPYPADWVLPGNSGSGRRVVYSKTLQRVWAVDSYGVPIKTHLVSGKLKWCDPQVGTYSVFSRSRYTNSIQNPSVTWGYMIRFTTGCEGGNIGFHEIPKENGNPVQSIWDLGTPLSAGCVRQSVQDAIWMWNWAWVGTKVVVLP